MTRLLLKRFLRTFRDSALRYIALTVLVAAVVTVVVSLESAAYTILLGRRDHADAECIEDGQFTTLYPLTDEQLEQLTADYGVTLQKAFSADVTTGSVVYRAFAPRKSMDLLILQEGSLPADDCSLVLEQNFARDHGIVCGDALQVGDRTYTVCGTGCLPDYVHSTRHQSDMSVTSDTFGWVVVSEGEFRRLFDDPDNGAEYVYAYRLGEETDPGEFSRAVYSLPSEELTAQLEADPALRLAVKFGGQQLSNVQSFVEREDNRRMDVEVEYAIVYRTAGWMVGVMLVGMLAFIFAVVTRNQIRNDHCVIGSLYALGVSKRTLMLLYVTPSVLIALAGGILGLTVGYTPYLHGLTLNIFHLENSFPYYEIARPLALLLYALAMPPAVNLAVNCCVLDRSLSHPALALIRGTYESRKTLQIPLRRCSFIGAFQLRRLIEERGSLIVLGCLLFSVTLFMLGLTTKAMVNNNEQAVLEQTRYGSLCTLKNPMEAPETAGEKLVVREMKTEYRGQNVCFSLVGLPENSRFFDFSPAESTGCAIAGEAIATKLGLQVGDYLTFHEGVAESGFTFKITEIVPAGANLELYIHIDSLREILGAPENYANVLLFDGEPDIDPSLIYSVTRTEDILSGIRSMRRSIRAFIRLAYISSILIFCTAMFLVVSTMIDRVASGISLLRVFGFRYDEVRRMYIHSLIYSVVFALLLAIPIGKLLSDRLSPIVYAYLAVGMFFDLPLWYYLLIFEAALLLFLPVLGLLMGKVRRIPMSVVLKSRE